MVSAACAPTPPRSQRQSQWGMEPSGQCSPVVPCGVRSAVSWGIWGGREVQALVPPLSLAWSPLSQAARAPWVSQRAQVRRAAGCVPRRCPPGQAGKTSLRPGLSATTCFLTRGASGDCAPSDSVGTGSSWSEEAPRGPGPGPPAGRHPQGPEHAMPVLRGCRQSEMKPPRGFMGRSVVGMGPCPLGLLSCLGGLGVANPPNVQKEQALVTLRRLPVPYRCRWPGCPSLS